MHSLCHFDSWYILKRLQTLGKIDQSRPNHRARRFDDLRMGAELRACFGEAARAEPWGTLLCFRRRVGVGASDGVR
jgi:hypothetical protein